MPLAPRLRVPPPTARPLPIGRSHQPSSSARTYGHEESRLEFGNTRSQDDRCVLVLPCDFSRRTGMAIVSLVLALLLHAFASRICSEHIRAVCTYVRGWDSYVHRHGIGTECVHLDCKFGWALLLELRWCVHALQMNVCDECMGGAKKHRIH